MGTRRRAKDGEPAGWEVFYRVVRAIPRGRVCTYGGVAREAGLPGYARQVGYALAALRDKKTRVPWHRVLGTRGPLWGEIRLPDEEGACLQRDKLEAEGVTVDGAGRVSLARFGWPDETPETLEKPRKRPKPRG